MKRKPLNRKTASTVKAGDVVYIDPEWNRFSRKYTLPDAVEVLQVRYRPLMSETERQFLVKPSGKARIWVGAEWFLK